MILSSERSGSTLLRVMLGKHSRVFAPGELWLMRYATYDAWREDKPLAINSLREVFDLLGQPKSVADVDRACVGRATLEVYRWVLGFLPEGSCLVDKTPAYATELGVLLRSRELSPSYLWLIRHPAGVIDSHLRLKAARHKTSRSYRSRLFRFVCEELSRFAHDGLTAEARRRERLWRVQNANVLLFSNLVPASAMEKVYYENLVRTPERELARLCATLGLEFEATILDPSIGRREVKPGLGDPNFGQYRAVRKEVADAWRERLHVEKLERRTRRLMDEIGDEDAWPLAADGRGLA